MDLPFKDKLTNIKGLPDGSITCGCPICINQGHDSKKDHLRIWKNLAFNCAKHPSDKAHNVQIRNILYDEVNEGDIDNWRELIGMQEEKVEIVKLYPENMLDKLIKNNAYWEDRGVKTDVLELIGGGVASIDEKSKLSGRWTMPCRDKKNRIVGWGGRIIDPNCSSLAPRWKLLGPKTEFIFPHVSLSLPSIRKNDSVILVEGIGCSLAFANYGYYNALCLFGIKPSSSILSLLISLNVGKIFIATNNEKSGVGNRAAANIKEVLENYFGNQDVIIHLPYKKDFLEMNGGEMNKWLEEYRRINSNLVF